MFGRANGEERGFIELGAIQKQVGRFRDLGYQIDEFRVVFMVGEDTLFVDAHGGKECLCDAELPEVLNRGAPQE